VKTNDSTWMQPVLDVVKSTDLDLFTKIHAAHWTVTVVDKPEDLMYLTEVPGVDFAALLALESALSQADGVTGQKDPALPAVMRGNTWLNRLFITAKARNLGVPVEHFAADVLVHEFAHHAGASTEPPAYAASRAFAMEMGDAVIAKDSDDTLKLVQQHGLDS
jgi:hypothetical protein